VSPRGARRALALSLTAALALSVAAPAGAAVVRSETGVSKNEIKIGMHLPLSGPAAPGYSDIKAATEAYFDYVNSNGGINGRKLTLVAADNKYPSPADTRRVVSQMVSKDKVFTMFGGLGTPTHGAVIEYLNRAKVPDLFILSGNSGFNAAKYPRSFSGLPAYEVEAKIMARYMKDTPSLSSLRPCLLLQKDDFGRGGERGFKTAGTAFTATGSYNTATAAADIQTQVVRFAQSGCQLIVVFGITSATAGALRVAAAINYAPQWISTAVGADLTILKAAGVPDAQLNNLHSGNLVPAESSDAYVSKIEAILKAKNVPVTTYTVVGVNNAYLLAQAIKAAGKNPTRVGLVKAMTNVSKFKTASLVPVRYTARDRSGYQGLFMARYVNGVQTKQSDVYVTNAGSGAVTVSTFKRPAAPAKLLP
jgi:branched-chain amino acid transport system substrate-binding protein